jgi:endo-1,3(4)-beta-glucanase
MECYNYIHPFSIGSTCRPHRVLPMRSHSRSFVVETFVEDLTISCPSDVVGVPHRVAAFDDLSALDVSPTFCTHLIRGCPYVTLTTAQGAGAVDVVVASVHAFMEVASCNQHATKWHLRMNSGQTFLLYASASIRLAQTDNTHLSALGFAGVIRVAYLPDTSMEPVLDRYSRCFPTSGEAASRTTGARPAATGELLMLAHLLHLRLLAPGCGVKVLDNLWYRSIDGDLVGVVRSVLLAHFFSVPTRATAEGRNGTLDSLIRAMCRPMPNE